MCMSFQFHVSSDCDALSGHTFNFVLLAAVTIKRCLSFKMQMSCFLLFSYISFPSLHCRITVALLVLVSSSPAQRLNGLCRLNNVQITLKADSPVQVVASGSAGASGRGRSVFGQFSEAQNRRLLRFQPLLLGRRHVSGGVGQLQDGHAHGQVGGK